MRAGRLALLAALLGVPACATGQGTRSASPAPVSFTRADTAKLHRTLDSLANAHHGVVGYTVHDIDTGERMELRGDETFPTASLIKVPILVTVYENLLREGTLPRPEVL